MSETKTEKVIRLVGSGEWKKALSILRTFRLGFTKEQKRIIEVASDVMNGYGNLYRGIGVDTDRILEECKAMILKRYHLAD